MKTSKIIINSNIALKVAFMFVGLLVFNGVFAQGGTHPGMDPEGMSVPIDGGILMAILALGSLGTMFFKKKKDNK